MESDRELLEMAAKANGIDGWKWCNTFGGMKSPRKKTPYGYATSFWNPLTDNGDAFRLAVKLDMEVWQALGEARATANEHRDTFVEKHGSDRYAATRRCIVRAAASLALHREGGEQ